VGEGFDVAHDPGWAVGGYELLGDLGAHPFGLEALDAEDLLKARGLEEAGDGGSAGVEAFVDGVAREFFSAVFFAVGDLFEEVLLHEFGVGAPTATGCS
jgi:hypothetical protein